MCTVVQWHVLILLTLQLTRFKRVQFGHIQVILIRKSAFPAFHFDLSYVRFSYCFLSHTIQSIIHICMYSTHIHLYVYINSERRAAPEHICNKYNECALRAARPLGEIIYNVLLTVADNSISYVYKSTDLARAVVLYVGTSSLLTAYIWQRNSQMESVIRL